MGLFGKRPARTGSGRVLDFLNKADDAYMLVFESKNIKPLTSYADPAVCNAVLQEVLSGKDHYFGAAKLRKRTWQVTLDDGRVVSAVKTVSHEAIKAGRGVSIPLGDAISQVWDVRVDGGPTAFKVIRIGKVKD